MALFFPTLGNADFHHPSPRLGHHPFAGTGGGGGGGGVDGTADSTKDGTSSESSETRPASPAHVDKNGPSLSASSLSPVPEFVMCQVEFP